MSLAAAPKLWRRLEQLLDRALGARANPIRHLGALAFLAFWLLALSGLWLYAVLDTSASGAYASIEALSRVPWSIGGVLRSMHRYGADAFVMLTALHLLRELLHGRFRHFRRFSWLTGSALLPIIAVSAVGGFWLNWDRLGQFSATATAEWLDALPLLGSTLARNFLTTANVSDRLFSLFVFVHVGMPLLLVFGLWFHIQRITRAEVFPPRPLAVGFLATLLALALALPIQSQGPAQLTSIPPSLAIDWFILFAHPLMYATSAGLVWAIAMVGFLALLLLPFVPTRIARPTVAVVDPDNCSGCQRCFVDCPYAAITMAAHPSKRAGHQIAVVDADLCAGCGICVGACPSSTPFRHIEELVTGIDMPQQALTTLRSALRQRLQQHTQSSPHDAADTGPIVLFRCSQGADASAETAGDVITLPLICTGQLPPSFIDYALRDGAAAVVVATCRLSGCTYRLGAQWTSERLSGAREPHLRAAYRDAPNVMLIEADAGENREIDMGLTTMRARLTQFKATSV